ncbi:MAG: hypothetical protein RL376_585 [Verrucomicrobiota bacterium]|jgi:hypothetical protein
MKLHFYPYSLARLRLIVLVLLFPILGLASLSAQKRPPGNAPGPVAALSLILGRPTDRSITLSVVSASEIETCVEYGPAAGPMQKTTPVIARPNWPLEIELTALKTDTAYQYRLLSRSPGRGEFKPEPTAVFHTRRAPGQTFTFALQGDSHPEREGKMFAPDLYTRTLQNVAADAPDFYLMMGDDFSIERLIQKQTLSPATVDQVYARQRGFVGLVGRAAPLFLVNGNHEQAARSNLDGTPENCAILAGLARTRFFPLPAPDAFYSGNSEPVEHLGLPRDYYAWTWGDALFVVIDPYWHSAVTVDNEAGKQHGEEKGKSKDGKARDLWGVTLGDTQYRWLTETLTKSRARWKFVFSHHVLGTGRGGIEQAGFYEWGGQDRSGREAFAAKRPGWPLPIHDLFVKSGVTIFFQGHDHIYARQELDGVTYQSCPNPADPTYQAFNREAYRSGDIFPNSGHLRVTVAPESVRVDYIGSRLPADTASTGVANATLIHSYTLPARTPTTPKPLHP